jgi:tetratricopeptide (TPR) repeat protein
MFAGNIQPEALNEELEALDWLRSGKLLLAKYRLAKLCRQYPHVAKFRFNHALVLYKLKQYVAALDEVTTGLLLQPGDEKGQRFKQELLARVSTSIVGEKNETAPSKIASTVESQAPGKQPEGTPPVEPGAMDASGQSPELRLEAGQDVVGPPITMLEFPEEAPAAESPANNVESGEQESLSSQEIDALVVEIKALGKSADDDATSRADPRLQESVTKIKKIAQGLYESAQYEQALLLYSAFVDHFPEDLESLFTIGFCHRELANFEESEKIFKHIIELFYDNAYAWHNLALLYAITGEGDKELYCLRKTREFGYFVDVHHLASLELQVVARNPFDSG